MKFLLSRTSSPDNFCEIEVSTVQDLLDAALREGKGIILWPPVSQASYAPVKEWRLEVYDDYRE